MFKLRTVFNVLRIALVLIFLYIEFLIYFALPFKWANPIECKSSNCIKILLVADPQILGEQDSNFIAKWDCDRFLRRTFDYAFDYAQPDLVIFLGDEMDEGHISSDRQFKSDLNRFRSIFDIPEDVITIYIPGDNDIGGEGDPILPQVVHRFDKEFEFSSEPITFQNLEFYKVNKMTQMFEEPDVINDDQFRIGISHMPILRKIHTFSKQIASSVKPHLIFSGHDHNSLHISAPLDDVWNKKIDVLDPTDAKWFKYKLNKQTIHEIIVPTCSYRMGMLHMGYGYAIIDQSNGILSFSVLWLPQRLIHLFTYLGILIFLAVVGIFYGCFICKRRVQRIARTLRMQHHYANKV